MASKKPYVVTFFKTVSTDFGEDREIRQRTVEVVAANDDDALKEAQAELCRKENLANWTLHADRYEINEVGFPS